MLDIKFVRDNPDAVKENIKKKFQDAKLPLVDEVIEKDAKYRECLKEVEESLKQALGSEVRVAYHDGKGKLTVHFYSDDQLKAFANLLGQYSVE